MNITTNYEFSNLPIGKLTYSSYSILKGRNQMRLFKYIYFYLFIFVLPVSLAFAAEDWNKEIDWWDWISYGELELCPVNINEPCYRVIKTFDNKLCRNISGDFENVASGMESERNQFLNIKFFSCDATRSNMGVMCVDTAQDGGFEACGLIQIDRISKAAPRKKKQFAPKSRPDKQARSLSGATKTGFRLPSNETIDLWQKRRDKILSKPKRKTPPKSNIDPKKPESFGIFSSKAFGSICYIGPCDRPLDGTREVCYFDGNGWCEDCGWEYDNVCRP